MALFFSPSCPAGKGGDSSLWHFSISSVSRIVPVKMIILLLLAAFLLFWFPISSNPKTFFVVSPASFSEPTTTGKDLKGPPRKHGASISFPRSSEPLGPAELHFSLVDELSSPSATWRIRFVPTMAGKLDTSKGDHPHMNAAATRSLGSPKGDPSTVVAKENSVWHTAEIVEVLDADNSLQYRSVTFALHDEHTLASAPTHTKKKIHSSTYRNDAPESPPRKTERSESERGSGHQEWDGPPFPSMVEAFDRIVCEEYNVRSTTHRTPLSSPTSVMEDDVKDEGYADRDAASLHGRHRSFSPGRAAEDFTSSSRALRLGRCFFTVHAKEEEEERESITRFSDSTQENGKEVVEPFFTYRVVPPSSRSSGQQRHMTYSIADERRGKGRTAYDNRNAIAENDEEEDMTKVEYEKFPSRHRRRRPVTEAASTPCRDRARIPSYFRCSTTSLNQYVHIDIPQVPEAVQHTGERSTHDVHEEEESHQTSHHPSDTMNTALLSSSSSVGTATLKEVALPLYTITLLTPKMKEEEKGKRRRGNTSPLSSASVTEERRFRFDGEVGKEYEGFNSFFRMAFRIAGFDSSTPQGERVKPSTDVHASSLSSFMTDGSALNVVERQKLAHQQALLEKLHFVDFDIQFYSEKELFPGAREKAKFLERTARSSSSFFLRWMYPLCVLLLFYAILIGMNKGIQWWYRKKSTGSDPHKGMEKEKKTSSTPNTTPQKK